MKSKNVLAILLSACVGLTTFASAGCGSSRETAGNRLELIVYNYNGGIGTKWLDAAKIRFEEANKNRKFDSGKEGVFIEIVPDSYNIAIDDRLNDRAASVFFLEGVDFNEHARRGRFLQIDDVVKGENPYETDKTVESKLSENTKAALSGLDGHYYAVPHYQAYSGVSYNKTLFDRNQWYFAKNPEDYIESDPTKVGYGFVKKEKGRDFEKSVGPDGIAGTNDDGLPSSVDEFKALCEYIKKTSAKISPFIFFTNAGNGHAYQQKLYDALWTNMEGYEGTLAQFTFEGNTSIITGFDADDNPITEDITLNGNNAWKVFQQTSKYHALRFAKYVFGEHIDGDTATAANYHKRSGDSTSQYEIQRLFLEGEAAMLLEGTYWRNEAEDYGTFDNGSFSDIETRFMPLPVQGTGKVEEGGGKELTVIDILQSYAFINANTEKKHGKEVLQIAKEFLQFCCTDESLAEFTTISSVTKDFNYALDNLPEGTDYKEGANYKKLSDYGKSVWDIKENGKVVNPVSGNKLFINSTSLFTMYNAAIWRSKIGGTEYAYPTSVFTLTGNKTAKDYFEGMKKSQTWWDGLSR